MTIITGYDANDDPLEMAVNTGIHLPRTLRFVSSEEGFSVYRDTRGDAGLVYLQHGTGRELYSFAELLDKLGTLHDDRRHWMLDMFQDYLRTLTYEPDDIDEIGRCGDCGDAEHTDDLYGTHGGQVCESCLEDYWFCGDCEEYFTSTTTTLNDTEVCESCRNRNWHYCEACEGWANDEDGCGGDHDDDDEEERCDSECESPAQSFTVRNDGLKPLRNDSRTTITLPAGVISEQGMDALGYYLRDHARDMDYLLRENGGIDYDNCPRVKIEALSWRLDEVGDTWQTKEGNFTKRLSRFAYKQFALKLPPAVISQVGCIASDHSKGQDYEVGFTRDLNMPAEAFAHEDSCWWQSYYEGRCALKSNGGLAMRTFTDSGYYNDVNGRAWIIPLKLVGGEPTHEPADNTRRLEPTFETLTPDAFIVFNGYGNLSGYAPARIMSHMAGMTYRKIAFNCYLSDYNQNDMYVNSSAGYLVAPEEIAEKYTDGSLTLRVDKHSNLHNDELDAQYAASTFQHKETANV